MDLTICMSAASEVSSRVPRVMLFNLTRLRILKDGILLERLGNSFLRSNPDLRRFI